jgi:trk system potassium uptake protein TrkH
LKLPAAAYVPINWIDALFMATSAFCVTGLTVFPINEVLTPTGLVILAGLIQLGGLGIMTLTMGLSVFFGGRLSVRERMYLGDLLAEERMGEVVKLLRKITYVTLFLEVAGGLGIYYCRERTFANFKLYHFFEDWFHAISAFCNAGFTLFPRGETIAQPMSFLWIITALVVLGSLGFPVLTNIGSYLLSVRRIASRRVLLSYTSKIVLLSAVLLLAVGTPLLYFADREFGFFGLNLKDQIFHSFFIMATSRTSGFSLLAPESLGLGGALLMILFMWIGGGPASTAGGVKTVTIAVAYFSLNSVLKGLGGRVEALGREISPATVTRAHAVIMGSMTFIAIGTLALVFLEPEMAGISLLFEATSAFSTVGLSHGVTSQFSDASKLVVTGLMFVGRVGLLTFLSSWVRTREIPNFRLLKESFPIN